MRNQSVPLEFVLTDFADSPILQSICFIVFLIIYLIGSIGNLMIVFIIHQAPQLWTPMYFFIVNLASLDMSYISTIVPNLLVNFLKEKKTISYGGCVVQLYFFLMMAATESSLLAAMSYDRYVAICQPLRYSVIMNREACLQLTVSSWVIGIIYSMIHTSNTFRLNFCTSNVIDHFFCDIPPLLKISCTDTRLNEVMVYGVGAVLILPCFPLIIVSYTFIIQAILRIPSATGRRKTFSTCISHIMVVGLFYLTGSSVYLQPLSTSSSHHQDKVSAVFYTILVPMANPIIYSLRNKDLKKAISKTLKARLSYL